LNWFKENILADFKSESDFLILNENIKWIITVPAIWKQSAKSFMREAAYQVQCRLFIVSNLE
jgi:hypothetical protein